MTTRDFSATSLPHPRYSLEVGRFAIKSTRDAAPPPPPQRPGHRQKQPEPQLQERSLDNANFQRHEDNTTSGRISKRDGSGGGGSDDDVNLPSTCLPRFSQLAQVVEVKLPGFTLPNRVGSNIKDFLGSYCVIENARPELFIRRDFISKFVDKGTIHVAQLSDHQHTEETPATTTTHRAGTVGSTIATNTTTTAAAAAATTIARAPVCGYKLSTTRDNVLILTMNSKQYHRFGMLATKEILPLQQQQPPARRPGKGKKSKRLRNTLDKCYRVEINLRDGRIMKSNKYQDKLMQTLGRLNSINKIYFRFIPDKSKLDLSLFAAHEYSQEFFNCIIDEYKLDGCQPVPLTKCSIALQKVQRNWINRAQLHPSLELSKLLAANQGDQVLFRSQPDEGADNRKLEMILNGLVDIIDWHGYQLLSLDCDALAKLDCCWLEDHGGSTTVASSRDTKGPSKRYDVSCTRIIGAIDYQHVQSQLHKLFTYDKKDDVVFRAMFLYDAKDDKQLLLCDHEDDSILMDTGGGGDSGQQISSSLSVNHIDESRPGTVGAATSGGVTLCGTNSGVVYLQDCSNGPGAASEITVIGLSELAAA